MTKVRLSVEITMTGEMPPVKIWNFIRSFEDALDPCNIDFWDETSANGFVTDVQVREKTDNG